MNNIGWVKFLTEADFNDYSCGYRVKESNWEGPGWYWAKTWEQRCPRNCCYDSCISIITASERISELQQEIKELAYGLKEAKDKLGVS